MTKQTVQPVQVNALYDELRQFLKDFNELHDSLVKEIKWMPRRQNSKAIVHDLMNQHSDLE